MSFHDQSAFGRTDDVVLAGAVFSKRLNRIGTGLIAGTRVETAQGWKPVELVRKGEKVHTYDGGLQPVTVVERTVFGANVSQAFAGGLLMVPGGALDNCDAVYLLPDQHVLLESSVAEEVLGNPATLVPAAALEGYRGIQRVMPVDLVEVVTLIFDDEEVVYTNSGTMLHCPPRHRAEQAMNGRLRSAFFQVLPLDRARALIDLIAQDHRHSPVWSFAEAA